MHLTFRSACDWHESTYTGQMTNMIPLTGTRMAVRFFAGFDMQSIDMDSEDMVKTAYAKGVTMGADLFSQDNQTPQFLVWAQRDKL